MTPEEFISNSGTPEPSYKPLPFYDLEKRFNYHAPTPDKVGQHETIRQECKALAYKLQALVPAGRELSVAITHLEDAMMWANAGIARS